MKYLALVSTLFTVIARNGGSWPLMWLCRTLLPFLIICCGLQVHSQSLQLEQRTFSVEQLTFAGTPVGPLVDPNRYRVTLSRSPDELLDELDDDVLAVNSTLIPRPFVSDNPQFPAKRQKNSHALWQLALPRGPPFPGKIMS